MCAVGSNTPKKWRSYFKTLLLWHWQILISKRFALQLKTTGRVCTNAKYVPLAWMEQSDLRDLLFWRFWRAEANEEKRQNNSYVTLWGLLLVRHFDLFSHHSSNHKLLHLKQHAWGSCCQSQANNGRLPSWKKQNNHHSWGLNIEMTWLCFHAGAGDSLLFLVKMALTPRSLPSCW